MPPWSSSRSWRPNATPDPPRGSEQLGDDREAGRPPRRPDQPQGPAAGVAGAAPAAVRPARPGAADRRPGLVPRASTSRDLQRVSLDERQPEITLQDRAGASFASFGDRHGEYLALEQISPWLPKAVIAIEDRRFYQHPGHRSDRHRAGRSCTTSRRAGVVQGGSTISQQLAKIAFLTPERSFAAQGQGGALHACGSRRASTRTKILELYLNRVYLGSGAYGVDAAARRYFAKPASELSLAEAAHARGPDQGAVALCADARSRTLARAARRGGARAPWSRPARSTPSGRAGGQGCARAAGERRRPAPAPATSPTGCSPRAGSTADADQPRARGAHHARPALQRAAEEAVEAAFAPGARGKAAEQAALVAMTPGRRGARHARRPRLRRRASSTARPRPSASRARRSSCSSTWPASRRACARRTDLGGADRGRRLGAAQTTTTTIRRSITPARRLRALDQHRGGAPGRAGRPTRVIRLAERLGITSRRCATTRASRSAARRSPARADRRLCLDRERRPSGVAGGDRVRSRAAPARRSTSAARSTSRCSSRATVRAMTAMLETALDRGTGRAGRAAPLRRRQDRHQLGKPRRLVRRLHRPAGGRASGSATTTARR